MLLLTLRLAVILALIVSHAKLLLQDDSAVLLSLLDPHVFEVSPFLQDLHGLDVLDCSQLLSVILVSAQRVKVYLLA